MVAVVLASLTCWLLPAGARPTPDAANPVKAISILKDPGGRVDWSPKGDQIAFDKPGPDGYFEVYVMQPDGTGERCLTCDKKGIPNKHKGNPAFSPSGQYVVFQAEKQIYVGPEALATPGAGIGNDLWLTTADGDKF